jgi:hypothetical protein
MRASERHLSAGCSVAHGVGEFIIHANLLERPCLEEPSVRVTEVHALSPEPLEFPMRDNHGNRLTSTRQFDFDTSFGRVDDPRETGAGLGDGIPLRHADECTSRCTSRQLDGATLFHVRGVSSLPAEARARVIQERLAAVAADRTISIDPIGSRAASIRVVAVPGTPKTSA